MNARPRILALAHSLADEASAEFARAEQVRSEWYASKHPGRHADPARHIEAAGFSYHSQALGVLKVLDILDEEST